MNGARAAAAAAIAAIAALLAGGAAAHADPVPATSLMLAATCADGSVLVLGTAAAGGDGVAVDGPVVSLNRDADGTVRVRTDCGDGQPVTIRVPPGLKVTVNASRSGPVTLRGLSGPVTLALSGSGDVTADALGPLTAHASEQARLSVGALNGPAVLAGEDASAMEIGSVRSPSVTIKTADGASIAIGGGHVGRLTVKAEDGSRVRVAAGIDDADADSSDGARIDLAGVSGTLTRNADDASSIRVGGRDRAEYGGGGGADGIALAMQEGRRAAEDGAREAAEGAREAAAEGRRAAEDGRRMAEAARRGERRDARGDGFDLTPVLILVAVATVGFLALRGVRRGTPALPGSGSRRDRDPAIRPPADPAIASLLASFDRIAQRTGRLEHYVTSREFELHRGFRDIGDD